MGKEKTQYPHRGIKMPFGEIHKNLPLKVTNYNKSIKSFLDFILSISNKQSQHKDVKDKNKVAFKKKNIQQHFKSQIASNMLSKIGLFFRSRQLLYPQTLYPFVHP